MDEKGELEIISARPLSNAQKDEAIRKSREVFRNIEGHTFKVDPDIVGGIIFKSEDKILDLSVLSKINQIKKHLEG